MEMGFDNKAHWLALVLRFLYIKMDYNLLGNFTSYIFGDDCLNLPPFLGGVYMNPSMIFFEAMKPNSNKEKR